MYDQFIEDRERERKKKPLKTFMIRTFHKMKLFISVLFIFFYDPLHYRQLLNIHVKY